MRIFQSGDCSPFKFKQFLDVSLIFHLLGGQGFSFLLASAHETDGITFLQPIRDLNKYYVKFKVSIKEELTPQQKALDIVPRISSLQTFNGARAVFGPLISEKFEGYIQPVFPTDACVSLSRSSLPEAPPSWEYPWVAVISRGNCSFLQKALNAEQAGFSVAIIYGYEEETPLTVMEASTPSFPASIPAYFVNYTSGTFLSSLEANSSRSPLLTIVAQSTAHPTLPGQYVPGDKAKGKSAEDEDTFGEHYFHICIYIWACVVVSSLIALSVVMSHVAVIYCQKWGCCGRSLTRWEVKRIPLKRFQRTEGEDCQDKCPICHEEFHEGRLIRQLPCNHCYHSYCVDRWLVKMSNRCPLCKQRVSISLFCPWNKQRRKKDLQGHLGADADVEASVDESPPLPPLSTLTPSNWYGDAIMSGPSKFIIMRPGKPTRVIDVREQRAKAKVGAEGSGDENAVCLSRDVRDKTKKCWDRESFPGTSQGVRANVCSFENEHFPLNRTKCTTNICPPDEADDICRPTRIPSSRSSSVSSDQPLLIDSTCCMVDEEDKIQGNAPAQCCSSNSKRCKKSIKKHKEGGTVHLCKACLGLEGDENITASEATVTLSSGSSSVVSCSFRSLNSDSSYLSPSTHKAFFIPGQSANNPREMGATSVCGGVAQNLAPSTDRKHCSLPVSIKEGWDSSNLYLPFDMDVASESSDKFLAVSGRDKKS